MYSRIRIQFLLIAVLLIVGACENKPASNGSGTSSEENISISPDFLKQNFPVLHSISKEKDGLHLELNKYAFKLKNASKVVKSDDDLQELFDMRDNGILSALHKEVLDPLAINNGVFYHSEEGTKLDEELKSLGMRAIYAEGMYIDLGPGEMLTKEMEQYASEVFRLYMDFQSAKTTSMMGEYPYLDLEGEGKMVSIGEKMRINFPHHVFSKKIEKDFRNALMPFTDVHMVKSEFDKSYITSGLATDFYPFATNVNSIQKFTEDHPESQYTQVVKNTLETISEMESFEGKWKDLYAVVLNWHPLAEEKFIDEEGIASTAKTCIEARQIRYELLDKGIDVSTVLQLPRKNAEECAVVYRFYADKKKADAALKTIKSKVEKVEGIVTLTFDPLKQTWSLK